MDSIVNLVPINLWWKYYIDLLLGPRFSNSHHSYYYYLDNFDVYEGDNIV